MSNYYLTLRGTGERLGDLDNMLGRALPPWETNVQWADIGYEASIGPVNERRDIFGSSLLQCMTQGAALLIEQVRIITRNDPSAKITIAGYSLGALVLNHAKNGLSGFPQVKTLVLLGNPLQDAAHGIHIHNPGRAPWRVKYTGIATTVARPFHTGIPTYELSHPMDPIAHVNPLSPLRRVVPWLWAMDLNDRAAWLRDLTIRLRDPNLLAHYNFFDGRVHSAFAETPDDINRYARGGFHTAVYSKPEWRYNGAKVSALDIIGRLARK